MRRVSGEQYTISYDDSEKRIKDHTALYDNDIDGDVNSDVYNNKKTGILKANRNDRLTRRFQADYFLNGNKAYQFDKQADGSYSKTLMSDDLEISSYDEIDGVEGSIDKSDYVKTNYTLDKAEEYIIAHYADSTLEPGTVEKALWYYRSKLTNSGDGKHHYDDNELSDSYVGEAAIDLAKTAKKYKDTNGGNITSFNVEWKNVGEVTVSYDAEDPKSSFYVVGPFSLKYDNSVNTKNATLELYTNKDISGIDLKGGLQERFGIIHCDSQGKIVSGYNELNKEFPESEEIFYIKLIHTEADAENIENENFLAVPRIISNIKVKVRKEVPKVDVVCYENTGIRKNYKVNSSVEVIGKTYTLEEIPGDTSAGNWSPIFYIRSAKMIYQEREVNKYLDIKTGKIIINSCISSENDFGDELEVNNQVTYRIKVTGNIFEKGGSEETYKEEVLQVPLSGSVISRDYAWVGNKKPKITIEAELNDKAIQNYNMCYTTEEEDSKTVKKYKVDVENSLTGMKDNILLKSEKTNPDLPEDEGNKYTFDGECELENGILKFDYFYFAKDDIEKISTKYEDKDSVYSYGKIRIDNIVKHDDSLDDSEYSLKGNPQAYLLTITPGENSGFYYGRSRRKTSTFKKVIIIEGRTDDETSLHEEVATEHNLNIGNYFETENIIWSKSENPPTYTVERLDNILENDENTYIDKFMEKYCYSEEEGYLKVLTNVVDGMNYDRKDDEYKRSVARATYRAILNEEETNNTSGTIVAIDREKDDAGKVTEAGKINVRFVSEHRKTTGEIVVEKIIEAADENDPIMSKITNTAQRTELFDELKDYLTFEFEIGIGTTVQTITLDKNYREPIITTDANGENVVDGYKWVWRSGQREWLEGNDLNYTVKENLNADSTIFSRIEEPINDSYEIRANIATGSFQELIAKSLDNNNNQVPIKFYSNFVYETGAMKITENISQFGSNGTMDPDEASPIGPQSDNKDNVRKMLANSEIFFNVEVNGIFSYANSEFGKNNYRIISKNSGYIDLDSKSDPSEEYSILLEGDEETLRKRKFESKTSEFVWIKGIPPKYKVEQDTQKIIETEAAKQNAEDSENGKDVNILRDLVSWQTVGTRTGELIGDSLSVKSNNDDGFMKFEFTNDIPTLKRDYKTGRLFIKQYVYGSEDYLKEVQKGFDFTYNVKVDANSFREDTSSKGSKEKDSNGITLLSIDNLKVSAQVADDGNYVWEWISPEITWDTEWLDTPTFRVELDKSKLPKDMNFDQAESVFRDLGNNEGSGTGSVLKNEVKGKLAEVGKNENMIEPTEDVRFARNLSVDERPETTDVFFYASYGMQNKSKIKLIQSLESEELLNGEQKIDAEEVVIAIRSEDGFTYNNAFYEGGEKVYYLTQNKDIVENREDAKIKLEIDKSLVNTYESNYITWYGRSPRFWLEGETSGNNRSVFPNPKNYDESQSIESPTGVITIEDTLFRKENVQNKKTSIVIRANDINQTNLKKEYSISLDEDYKKSKGIYFKLHIDNRADTYVKATYKEDAGGGYWEYQSPEIRFGYEETVRYTVFPVKTDASVVLLVANKTYIQGILQEGGLAQAEFTVGAQDYSHAYKARFHVVVLRDGESVDTEKSEPINFKIMFKQEVKDKPKGTIIDNETGQYCYEVKDTFHIEKGHYSAEWYSDYMYVNDNELAPYVVQAGKLGNKQPNYWKTNSGELFESDNKELINIVLDYRTNNNIKDDGSLVKPEEVELKINRKLEGEFSKKFVEHLFKSKGTKITSKSLMKADVYIQGYGTKKMALYSKGITPKGGLVSRVKNGSETRDLTDEEYMTWENKSFVTVSEDEGGFAFLYSEDNKYIRGNSKLINYSIVDYELPLGFIYKDEKSKLKSGTTASNIIPTNSKTAMNFSNSTSLNSRTIAVQNKFTDATIKGTNIKYSVEVSGTYTYFKGKEEYKVSNGMKVFTATASDDGELVTFEEDGEKVFFTWDYDSLPPRYNIILESGAKNIDFENASGYMSESGITYAIARNDCKKQGGYIGVTIDAENEKIVPNRRFNFVVDVWKKGKEKEDGSVEKLPVSSFVGEIDYRNNSNIWVSPRITWEEDTDMYYSVTPINSELYNTKVTVGGSEGKEDGPKFYDKGKEIKYFTMEENSYDDFVHDAYINGIDENKFTTIKYETSLVTSKINLKNVRIHAQNPDDKNNFNQEFKILTGLDGYCIVNGNAFESNQTHDEVLKSSSSDSTNNTGMSGVTIEVKHFPDDYVKVNIDEEIGNGAKKEYWVNTNISNSGNFLDGERDVYITNQYNEFKQIDLTTTLSGTVSLKDEYGDSVTGEKIDAEVYVKKYDVSGGQNYSDVASVSNFGVLQNQPVRPRKKDGKWFMSGVLIPQLYSNEDEIVEVFYLYDGQKYYATDENVVDNDYQHGSTEDRLNASDKTKVTESNYYRNEFNASFDRIYGKNPENIEKKTVSEFDSSKGNKKVEIFYEGEDGFENQSGELVNAESTIVNRNKNSLKPEYTLEASNVVLTDATNETIDDQTSNINIDYSDEDSYELLLRYPFDKFFYNKSSDKDKVIEFQSGKDKKVYASKKYMEQINLNLENREDVRVKVEDELVNVRMTSNGCEITPEISKEIKVSPTDYYYRTDVYKQNDKYGFLVNSFSGLDDSEMEIYMTFKYTIKNETLNYALKVNELKNYVTDSLEMVVDDVSYSQPNHHAPENGKHDINGKTLIAGPSYLKAKYGENNHYYNEFIPSTIPDYKTSDNVIYNKLSLDFTNEGKKDGLIIAPQGDEEIYVDFRIRKKTISGIIDSLDILDKEIKNIIEIGNYTTLNGDDHSIVEGKISNNFAPDNLNLAQCYSKYRYECDTASIEVDGEDYFSFMFDTENAYSKSGIVEEVDKNKSDLRAPIGGMTVQMLERMYLKDYMLDSEEPENASKYLPMVGVDLNDTNGRKAYDFLWSTDKALSVYGGRSFAETCENAGLSSDIIFKSTTETDMNGTGEYTFNNIPYGDFVIRVLYGIDKGTLDNTCGMVGEPVALDSEGYYYSKNTNGGEVLTANFDRDFTGTTPAVYNGQDYKGAYNGELTYGDDEARRIESMSHDMTFTNSNTSELSKLNDKAATHQQVYDNYYMYLNGTSEFTRKENDENINFAISERPENVIYLDQQIESIKVITNDNREIFDAEYDISYMRINDGDTPPENSYKIREYEGYSIYAARKLNTEKSVGYNQLQELYKIENKIPSENESDYPYGTGEMNFKYINMDHTILHGTTVVINYRISAINLGDTDYIGNKIYKPGSTDTQAHVLNNSVGEIESNDFGRMVNKKQLRDMATKIKNERAYQLGTGAAEGEYYKLGNYLGTYYYTKVVDDSVEPVQTRVRQVLDFIDNDAVFTLEYNATDNGYWRSTSAAELNGNGLQDRRLIEPGTIDVYKVLDKEDRAYVLDERNNLALSVDQVEADNEGISNHEFEDLTIPCHMSAEAPKETGDLLGKSSVKSINIISTKTVSSATDADNMAFEALSEITKYENTAGRRDVIMLLGNADPKKGEFLESLKERDASSTEIVTFMPPTGLNKHDKARLIIIIVIMVMAIGGGCTCALLKYKKRKTE
ncbi:MAG: hypothetical protein K6D97_08415 [Clostridia bacterium]|nr:hypothetical protein [Clostridia bacterium]